MKTRTYSIGLHINKIAGGFPSSEDAVRAFLQSPEMKRTTPKIIRDEVLGEAGLAEGLVATVSTSIEDGDRTPGFVYSGFRQDQEGNLVIHAVQIKAMLQQAAEGMFDTTGKPSLTSYKKAIKLCLDVSPEHVVMHYKGELGVLTIQQIVTREWPTSRIPSNRRRQVAFEVDVTFNLVIADLDRGPSKLLTTPVLKDLFDYAGVFIGLGTDRGYKFGRFEIREFTMEDDSGAGA